MEEPAHFQPTYEHKHWHLPLFGLLFFFATIVGGFVYVFYFQAPREKSTSPSSLVNGHFLNQKGEQSNFIKKGEEIYFVLSTFPTLTENLLDDAKPGSFQVLCESVSDISAYAKDADHVYFRGDTLEGADPQTFMPLYNADGSCRDYYAKDSQHVYYARDIISNRPASFVPMSPEEDLFSDGVNTFRWGELVASTTSQGTSILVDLQGRTSGYSKDSSLVYFETGPDHYEVVQGADVQTFTVLTCGVAPGDDGCETFYAKDKNRAYIDNKVWEGVDLATLAYVGGNVMKDANHVYYANYLDDPSCVACKEADSATFVYLGMGTYAGYFKDKNQVYSWRFPVESADPATFKVVSGQTAYDAQDKNHKYSYGRVVE